MVTINSKHGFIRYYENYEANHTGAMLAVMIPAPIAARLALPGGEPVAELHITLFYFGEAAELDAYTRDRIVRGAQAVSPIFGSFDVELCGTGVFEENAERPLYAAVNSPTLIDYRRVLAALYDKVGVPYSKDYEYHPHCTLKYLRDDPAPEVPVAERFTARELHAVFGGMHLSVPVTQAFARKASGQAQRSAAPAGAWEKVTNQQQRALVRAYDAWTNRVVKAINQAMQRGASAPERYAIFKDSLTQLQAAVSEVMFHGVTRAGKVVAGKRYDNPTVQRLISEEINTNRRAVEEKLIPNIDAMLAPAIVSGLALSTTALKQSFSPGRSMAAQYAGGAWVAIFKVQQGLGQEREAERRAEGLPIEPVRWVPDPQAQHCMHGDDGFYGCLELAGEYPGGWSTLKTVPAGKVSCRGNCRCHLEVYRDGKWQRGLYDD
jgi:2'-5' RNA ligase